MVMNEDTIKIDNDDNIVIPTHSLKRKSRPTSDTDDEKTENVSNNCELSREERRKLKKKKKMQLRRVENNTASKSDYEDVFGTGVKASLTLNQEYDKSLKTKDIHNLFLWTLTDMKVSSPKWIGVNHRALANKVVLVVVEGLTKNMVNTYAKYIPILFNFNINNNEPLSLKIPCSTYTTLCTLQHHLSCSITKIDGFKKNNQQIGKLTLFNNKNNNDSDDECQIDEQNNTDNHNSDNHFTVIHNPDKLVAYTPLSKNPGAANYLATSHELNSLGYPIGLTDNTTNNPLFVDCSQFKTTHLHSVEPWPSSYGSVSVDETSGVNTYTPLPANANTDLSITCRDNVPWDPQQLSLLRAIDCEMVMTLQGMELARVTMLNYDGSVLIDTLVLPEHEITDYLTQFSGITKPMMDKCTLSFSDAQQLILDKLSSHHILVGHSLENDLKAMKLVHSRIMDTVLLFPHPRGGNLKSSLKMLAQRHLNLTIQNKGTNGHDSVEDAFVALQLALKKLKKGPEYGVVFSGNNPFLDILDHFKCKHTMISNSYICKRFSHINTNCISAENDTEVVEKTVKYVKNPASPCFTLSHLSNLAYLLNTNKPSFKDEEKTENLTRSSRPSLTQQDIINEDIPHFISVEEEPDCTEVMKNLNTQIETIWSSLPVNTLFCVVSGQGSIQRAKNAISQSIALKRFIETETSKRTNDKDDYNYIIDQLVDGQKKKVKVDLKLKIEELERLHHSIVEDNYKGVCFLNIK